ncbi:thiamine pyrophosphate-dependent enzyme [Sphingosinicella microcystinivorans]|uniref:Acetolactate synthase-1/2/3 large subunit n=1 Tax=Sphingosinicella microcystinivorans TaxID=335406 RepID=A0ABX9SV05_SPHMI|nr:thiamine pyrophosphate-dependent enzyme [Sphingosinicella microcystinivorans]RKS85432.1 acetolactate synthase-1/2/3 large subunit [Sphingosinicella microcystinivorans]
MNAEAKVTEAAATMTGGAALVNGLIDHGIGTLFALPGVQIDPLFAALYDRSDEIRVVTSRHEQGAAYMAFGAARSTGKASAYAVVPGPGWLNASGALATAYGCNAPVVCLAGQIPSRSLGRGIGELHEVPDQLALARGLTKWAARADHPADAPRLLATAFCEARSGRPRPVHLEMATDVMAQEVPVGAAPVLTPWTPPVDPKAIERAVALASKAERPMILVGGGAQSASVEVTRLAERLHAPAVALRSGRGVVDESSWLAQGWLAGHALWADADLVIAIGTRLDFPFRHWGKDDRLAVIRIDVDPTEVARQFVPDVAIVADAAAAVSAILAELPAGLPRASRESKLRALKARSEADLDAQMGPQMAILRDLRAALPDDGFFVDELTQIGYASWSWFPTYGPRQYISSGYQGTLGYGFPTALGVKAANPDRAVLSISGDGGIMFAIQELASAVKYGLNTINIVFADNKFGNVQRIQRERYGGRVLGSDLHNPRFAELARDFGAIGVKCDDVARLGDLVAAHRDADRPVLIEVPVGDFPTPWSAIRRPPVRGQ